MEMKAASLNEYDALHYRLLASLVRGSERSRNVGEGCSGRAGVEAREGPRTSLASWGHEQS